jgi:hypothetical protein
MDELVCLGTDTEMAFYGMLVRVFIIVVINAVAVGFPLLAFKQG